MKNNEKKVRRSTRIFELGKVKNLTLGKPGAFVEGSRQPQDIHRPASS